MSVHDLGGQPGFGPVPVDDQAVFDAGWHRRAFAVTQFAQVASGFNTDAFRHGIEREVPSQYLTLSYFDKWIRNAERMLVEGGVIGADAVVAKATGGVATAAPERTTDARPSLARGAARSIDQPARFRAGERVQVTDQVICGHTRVPGYVRGHVGVIERVNDTWVFPDSHAHGNGEAPCWVYAVRFDAAVLWPDDGVDHSVLVDLYEPHLRTP